MFFFFNLYYRYKIVEGIVHSQQEILENFKIFGLRIFGKEMQKIFFLIHNLVMSKRETLIFHTVWIGYKMDTFKWVAFAKLQLN